MKDLNVKQKSIKILQENIGSNLFDISCSNFLSDMSPEARETKAKMNYLLENHQNKNHLHSKETINKTKRQPTEWEKIFSNGITDKGLVSKNLLRTYQTQHPKNKQSS